MTHEPQTSGTYPDQGFSLAELIVVLGLLGFVLAGAWAGFSVINKSQQVNESATVAARDLSNPIEQMSKMLMQNTEVQSASAYDLRVWTDRTSSGSPELDAFYVTSSGQLIWESWKYNSARTAFTGHNVWVMSTNNTNMATNTPLFTYYDPSGAVITNMSYAPSDTRSVKVTVKVSFNGGTTSQDVRTILFRNRN